MSGHSSHAPIVVIGGGTAGSTVTAHLAARTTCDIVLIEPGGVSGSDDVRGFFDVLDIDGVTRASDATVVGGRATRPYVEGRGLGGGSAVNGMILSGEVPPELEGLTRTSRREDTGEIGRALVAAGGEQVRLWWNGGRWNPGRAVAHLVEEGRIVHDSREATSLRPGDGIVTVRVGGDEIAASQVVMCAGAVSTPAVLLASGLGSATGAIGAGLQTHPMITFAVHRRVPAEAGNFDAASVRRGTTANGRSTLTVAYERAHRGHVHLGLLSTMVLDVESRGSVGSVDGRTVVDFNCLSTPGDRAAMVGAVRELIALCKSEHMARVATAVSVDADGTPVEALARRDDRDLEQWVLDHLEAASHGAASCASAVDPDGRLRGVPGVWVADASVLPGVPSCTPAGPVTMEARRIARCIETVVAGSVH